MKLKDTASSGWYLLRTTIKQWTEDSAAHHAAALSFYAIFSLAPILVIVVSIAGFFVGQEQIQDQIVRWTVRYSGSQQVANMVRDILENVSTPTRSAVAAGVSLIGLFVGATAIFSELRKTMNFIWNTPSRNRGGVRRLVVNRLFALAMVIGSGVVLVSSLLLNVALSIATEWVRLLPFEVSYLGQISSFTFLLLISTLVFAMIFKFVPDKPIAWSDVWIGAFVTAVLFSIGRVLISLYIEFSSVASAYGAAGALAILLIWIYYSAQVFFLGAEFTQVYARSFGTRSAEKPLLDEKPEEAQSYKRGDDAQKSSSRDTVGDAVSATHG